MKRAAFLLVSLLAASVLVGTTRSAAATSITKILVIMEENQFASSVTSTSAPYIFSVEKMYAQGTHYSAVGHPSTPNYLAIAGGSTYGITADGPPSQYPINAPSVFGQAIRAGHTAKLYAETATSKCDSQGTKYYDVHHNPWLYFTPSNERAGCHSFDVGFSGTSGALGADVKAGTLPNVGMVAPNVTDDGHTPGGSTGLRNADNWLKTELPFIMSGPDYKAGRLAIVITWDSSPLASSPAVDFIVVAPTVSHLVVSTAYDHYSLSRLMSDFGGSAPLLRAKAAPDMRAAFHL